MARNPRSVVEIGMELLQAQGAFDMADEEVAEAPPATATEAEVYGGLVAQLQAMVDRLAIDDRLGSLEAMMMNQAMMLDRMAELIMSPRRRIPVRDAAGTITEVMDVYVPPALPEGYDG